MRWQFPDALGGAGSGPIVDAFTNAFAFVAAALSAIAVRNDTSEFTYHTDGLDSSASRSALARFAGSRPSFGSRL